MTALAIFLMALWCSAVLAYGVSRQRADARLEQEFPAFVEAMRALDRPLQDLLLCQRALGQVFRQARRAGGCPVRATSDAVLSRAVRQLRRRQVLVGYRSLTRAYTLWQGEVGLSR